MKLLLISVRSECVRGGIATWTAHFLSHCQNNGIECDLINTDLIGRRAIQECAKRSFRDEFFRTRRIFRDLGQSLKTVEYDAAHLNTSCGTFGLFRDCMIARRVKRKGLRLVTHFHCDIPYWIHNPISRYCLGRLVALSDERLVLCESSRAYLEKIFGVSSCKVPNFVDDELIRRDDKSIADSLSTAFFVGRVSEAKGAHELYALAERLPHINFRLVGDVSDTVSMWKKPGNITLVGVLPHSEVLAEMDRADIFVFPSHSEGFSLALTEAMARGLPSVATDVGASGDMLSDGCGMIVDIGDVDAMVSAVETFATAASRREASRRALERVRKQYTSSAILKELKTYYQ